MLCDIRQAFLDYFRHQRRRGDPLVAAGAAGRPDAPVHQRRDGPVQGRLHRTREAPLPAKLVK